MWSRFCLWLRGFLTSTIPTWIYWLVFVLVMLLVFGTAVVMWIGLFVCLIVYGAVELGWGGGKQDRHD
mgnify:CR=1 FL=1